MVRRKTPWHTTEECCVRPPLRFDEDKQRRQEQQRQRQQQVYQQCPELESIQREIGGTMGEIIASALRRGTDPLPAIRVIRDKNLSLQKRRAELLAQLGYPEDYLSEKPRCTLCGDTGYRGDGLCSCLKKILCTGADPGAEPDAGHRQPEL